MHITALARPFPSIFHNPGACRGMDGSTVQSMRRFTHKTNARLVTGPGRQYRTVRTVSQAKQIEGSSFILQTNPSPPNSKSGSYQDFTALLYRCQRVHLGVGSNSRYSPAHGRCCACCNRQTPALVARRLATTSCNLSLNFPMLPFLERGRQFRLFEGHEVRNPDM